MQKTAVMQKAQFGGGSTLFLLAMMAQLQIWDGIITQAFVNGGLAAEGNRVAAHLLARGNYLPLKIAGILVCLALAICASGWVALLVSLGRTAGRINALGMALTLIFGILSRSFAAVIPTTPWMDTLARITPNYWGQHAFFMLALGGGATGVLRDLGALCLMCAALWAVAALRGRFPSLKRR